METELIIEVSNLNKVYKLFNKPSDRLKESLNIRKKKYSTDYYALKNINLKIKKGECVGFIGKNGAGKSTLLKILTGVLTPSSGNVRIDGKVAALLELGAGFNPDMTGIENIYLTGTIMGYSNTEIDNMLNDIIEFADIGEFINQPVKLYSSGMFARLAFAVNINVNPDILIVDEALSVGDVFFQAKCYKKFEELKKRGVTILFVTHSLSAVIKYCDHAVILNNGEKVAEGNPKEMVDLYKKVLVNMADVNLKVNNRNNREPESKQLENNKKWADKLVKNPNANEYGNNLAEIIDFAIIDENNEVTNIIKKGSRFSIKIKAKFKTHIEDPIFAFTILNLQGVDITGTNTLIENVGALKVETNETITVTFTQNMSLQGGEYLLSLGLTGYFQGEFTVYHRLYDICNLSVISDKNSVGFFDMNSTINIE